MKKTRVGPTTRAGKYGRVIECPKRDCKQQFTVGRFSERTIVCYGCKRTIQKELYFDRGPAFSSNRHW